MTDRECWSVLAAAQHGRLACAYEGQPYVVPISFAADHHYAYGFSAPGRKVDWMRNNPRVCLQVDEIRGRDHWTSVVAQGRYEELSDLSDQQHAHALLQRRPMWWEPGAVPTSAEMRGRPVQLIFYRIQIEQLTGRMATPS